MFESDVLTDRTARCGRRAASRKSSAEIISGNHQRKSSAEIISRALAAGRASRVRMHVLQWGCVGGLPSCHHTVRDDNRCRRDTQAWTSCPRCRRRRASVSAVVVPPINPSRSTALRTLDFSHRLTIILLQKADKQVCSRNRQVSEPCTKAEATCGAPKSWRHRLQCANIPQYSAEKILHGVAFQGSPLGNP